jgi:hypothetical protein
MQPKKIIKPVVVSEYKSGPDPSSGIRFCVVCRREFAEGETWLKQTRVGEYSVGIHAACAAENAAAQPAASA